MTRVFFALLSAVTFFFLAGAPVTMTIGAGDGTAIAQTEPKGDGEGAAAAKVAGEVDVDVQGDRGGGAWYLSPTWVVIGLLALGVLVAIIVAATRGGTTVIRD